MGETPYKIASELLREKLMGEVRKVDTPQVALGVALEPKARRAYCQSSGAAVEPACVQSKRHPWLRASLDGLSEDGQRVIEIKCGRAAYWRTATTGQPPTYYRAQLQHILAITGLPTIDFICDFPPLEVICLTIERDERYIEQLLEKEAAFWSKLEALRRCPRNTQNTQKLAVNGSDAAHAA